MKGRVLIIDDEAPIREILARILGYEGYQVTTAGSGGEGLTLASEQPFDLALLDVKMRGIDGLDTLSRLKQQLPMLQVIMISGHGTLATAVAAVKEGAFDFLEKPLDADRLLVAVDRALQHGRLSAENRRLREGLARVRDTRFVMVGESVALLRVRELVSRVAPTDARVLITGENGSGKELVARAIHDSSARAREPFIEVNCAAIPGELVESELFGHAKGSFTGASRDQIGKFEAADGGTLFLDEIGDLALPAQAKILRALQEGVITRVGESRSIPVDVRVIAATHRDPTVEVAEGRFREDLYFRLNVMPIQVPALRERQEDIPALISHFVAVLGNGPGMSPRPFTGEALRALQARRWPGNVRELRNAVERLLILAVGSEVTAADVSTVLTPEPEDAIDLDLLTENLADRSFQTFREDAERLFLLARLRAHHWNVAETARALGMPRSNLYNKIEKYAIERER